MQRWKLTIEYDGTPFLGWQRQHKGLTIQKTLEEAIEKFSHEKDILVQGSGRTDAGVHAVGQVAHVDMAKDFTEKEMRDATNHHTGKLPIVVLKAEKVSDAFHARYDAKQRYYRYRITYDRISPPMLDEMRAWHVRFDLDVDAMREGAKHLIGHHDFSSFRDAECQANSPMKTLDKIEIHEYIDPLRPGKQLFVDVEAKSFLHHQVRNIVGSLKRVGDGRWQPAMIRQVLEARDRCAADMNAPAHGLYFVKVDY